MIWAMVKEMEQAILLKKQVVNKMENGDAGILA